MKRCLTDRVWWTLLFSARPVSCAPCDLVLSTEDVAVAAVKAPPLWTHLSFQHLRRSGQEWDFGFTCILEVWISWRWPAVLVSRASRTRRCSERADWWCGCNAGAPSAQAHRAWGQSCPMASVGQNHSDLCSQWQLQAVGALQENRRAAEQKTQRILTVFPSLPPYWISCFIFQISAFIIKICSTINHCLHVRIWIPCKLSYSCDTFSADSKNVLYFIKWLCCLFLLGKIWCEYFEFFYTTEKTVLGLLALSLFCF